MGFYSPATIANDAKRHGVKIVPIDVQRSDWFCTPEELSEDDRVRFAGRYAVRMGLKYVKGFRQRVADAITEARLLDGPYASEYDLRRRVSSIKKPELTLLAKAGAFNWTGEKHHRRTALWNADPSLLRSQPLDSAKQIRFGQGPSLRREEQCSRIRLLRMFPATLVSWRRKWLFN
jgi:error-prone DNA polymerase